MTKKCFKCLDVKPVSEFHVVPLHRDGLASYCKPCKRDYDNKRQRTWYRKEKNENNRKYTKKSSTKRMKHDYYVAYKKERPLEMQARSAMGHAIRDGKLVPKPCMMCGEKKVDGHHHNGYSKEHWLDVVWLCRIHHTQVHRGTPLRMVK